jgi:hypothetical protein
MEEPMVSTNGACGTTDHHVAVVVFARIVDDRGRRIVCADVAAICYSIYAVDVHSGLRIARLSDIALPLEVRDVLFDRLVRDRRWTVDDVGYNFRHEVEVGDHVMRFGIDGNIELVYELTPKNGDKVRLPFQSKVV